MREESSAKETDSSMELHAMRHHAIVDRLTYLNETNRSNRFMKRNTMIFHFSFSHFTAFFPFIIDSDHP